MGNLAKTIHAFAIQASHYCFITNSHDKALEQNPTSSHNLPIESLR